MKRLLLIPILFLATVSLGQIVDQFTYTGALDANGWLSQGGTTGQITVLTTPGDVGNNLSYSGLATSAGNRTTLSSAGNQDINKGISGITGTGYFSFLLKVTNTTNLTSAAGGEYFIGFGNSNATNLTVYGGRVYIKAGATPNTFQLGIMNTTGGTPTPAPTFHATEYPIGTTIFVAVKLNLSTSPYTANLFINPVPGAVEPTPTVTNNAGTSTTSFTTFASIFLRQAGSGTSTTGNLEIDEIRTGSTWASVTPAGAVTCTNTTATIDTVSCATSYVVPSGHETYTVGGQYHDTIPNATGCDSILTINLSFVTSINYYPDTDGDGLGDNTAAAVPACTPPANHVTNNNDCDDTNPTIGAAVMYYVDADGDGYGSAAATGVPSCTQIPGSVTNNTDCNDNNAAIHPGAAEIPNNGIDEDCNGSDLVVAAAALGMYEFQGNDCGTPALDVTTQPANATFGPYGANGSIVCATASNVINYNTFNTSTAIDLTQYYKFSVTPANCYGLDLNMIKFNHRLSGTGGAPTLHVRSSLDNYAADLFTKQLAPSGTVYLLDTVHLNNAFDNVTSTVEFRFYITNMGAPTATYRHDNVTIYGTTNALPTQTYYADADGDGFGNPAVTQTACTAPAGYVSDNTDCDDTDEEEFPGAVWYADTDGDGLGAGTAVTSCTRPADHVSNNDDCDDTNAQFGLIQTYYVDADSDGYGDADATGVPSCAPIAGSVTNNDDCDDSDEDINPAAAEVCDGVDNNCDGVIDEGFTMVTYYEDADGDTYGDPASSVTDCTQPAGYVTNDDDCDDTNAAVHPGAVDVIGNGIDDNCDGIIDGTVGIEESILAQLNVYPNPGTSSVVLDLASGWNGFEVAFIGVDGKEIALTAAQKSITALEFNTTALVQGTYFIRLTSTLGTALVRWVKN